MIHESRVDVPLNVKIGELLSGMITIAVKLFVGIQAAPSLPHHCFVNRCARHRNIRTEIYFVLEAPGSLNEVLAQKQSGFLQALPALSRQTKDKGQLAADANLVTPLKDLSILFYGGLFVNIVQYFL